MIHFQIFRLRQRKRTTNNPSGNKNQTRTIQKEKFNKANEISKADTNGHLLVNREDIGRGGA